MDSPSANGLLIPKVFHRIWVGPSPPPPSAEACAASWLQRHPDWQLRLWTDDNLPALVNAAVFDQTTILAQKADILRHELLARYGGVYLDIDFECLQNIEPLLAGARYFYGDERPGQPATAILGCTPEHPFARWCIQRIPERWPWQPGSILEETGPAFFARALRAYLGTPTCLPLADPRSGREAASRLIPEGPRLPLVAFHPWVLYPYYLNESWRPEQHPEAYAVHHWQKNWS